MNGGSLVDQVKNLRNRGLSDDQIATALRNQNYNNQQINDAFSQARVGNAGGPQPLESFNVKSFKEPNKESGFSMGEGGNIDFPSPGELDVPTPSPDPNEGGFAPSFSFKEPTQSFRASSSPIPPAPSAPMQDFDPSPTNFSRGENNFERIEEIAESVVQEKWEDMMRSIGDISLWKGKITNDIVTIKQELIRTQERFENLQRALVGKIKDYDKDVREVGSEMKALARVFDKIIEPLTTNVKELGKITKELKGKKR